MQKPRLEDGYARFADDLVRVGCRLIKEAALAGGRRPRTIAVAHKRTGCPVLLRKAGRSAGGRYTLRGPADRSLRLRTLAANTAPARDGRMDAMGRLTARLAHPFYFYVSPVCRCGRKGRQTAGSKGVFNR